MKGAAVTDIKKPSKLGTTTIKRVKPQCGFISYSFISFTRYMSQPPSPKDSVEPAMT